MMLSLANILKQDYQEKKITLIYALKKLTIQKGK